MSAPVRSAAGRLAGPILVSGALAALYLIVQPSSADHAAQEFRTVLYEHQGLAAWNNLWFGGHHLPGYSILFPLLASLIGPRLVGAIAAVVASALFAEIAYSHWGDRARLGVIWFAAGSSISLFTGRLTFALGIAVAMAAVYAFQRGWRWPALALAALCPLASPVAALFLAGIGVAYSAATRRREGLELAVAAAGTAILVAITFPEGGVQPFSAESFGWALLITVVAFFLLPREERVLMWGVAIYAAILIGAFLIHSPMGSNALRMGWVLIGPLLACALWKRETKLLLAVMPVLLWWQVFPAISDLEEVSAEPSVKSAYYAPLRDYLRGATSSQEYRVEVVPADHHWEAAYVPRGIYIARGWERQLDRTYNSLFYGDKVKASEYRRWLDDLSVGFVAVPDAPLDYAGEAEAKLIAKHPPYLQLAFRSRDWIVYRVKDPQPLAIGAARLRKLWTDGFSLQADSTGSVLVRVRWTPYWTLERGFGCLQESPNGFTRVTIDRPGPIRVGADFSPLRILSKGPNCRHPSDDAAG